MVSLPKGIDYTIYHSDKGMKTKMWGPHAWNFLFVSILGAYPKKINSKNKEHRKIRKEFKGLLKSLQFVLPCVFCRNSFKSFLKELPIEPFLGSRIALFYWLYLMKDKVNQKLIIQERDRYNQMKKELKDLYKAGKITKTDIKKEIIRYRKESFWTKDTPPFEKVLRQFEKYRAQNCSKETKSCV